MISRIHLFPKTFFAIIIYDKKYHIYTIYDKFSSGWLGYSDELVKELCNKYLSLDFKHFKVKVGLNLEDDIRRCTAVRKYIGNENTLVNTK